MRFSVDILFNRAIVARGDRLERFTGLLRDNAKLDQLDGRPNAGIHMLGLAVVERSALVVQGDHLEVLGSANSHIFLKSNNGRTLTWHELNPGERTLLKQDKFGASELRRK